jgi:HprK-related kinase A
LVDGRAPSVSVRRRLVPPYVEWAMNWALATRLHRFLLIHAAVVERNGQAVVLAGPPGAGKSTLCAALVTARGWRLLSDEFLIVDPRSSLARPMPRPIALKDGAIAALAKLAAPACDGAVYSGTPKGALIYVKAPQESLKRQHDTARPSVIVFPRFTAGAALEGSPLPRARAFLRLADNAFNFALRGPAGFAELARMVEACSCWDLVFGGLEPAIDFIERAAVGATDTPDLGRRQLGSTTAS